MIPQVLTHAAEVSLIAVLLYLCVRIFRRSCTENMVVLGTIVVSALAANAVLLLLSGALSYVLYNIFIRSFISAVLALLVFAGAVRYLKNTAEKKYEEKMAANILSPAFDKALRILLVLLFWGVMLFSIDFVVDLAAVSGNRKYLENTLVLKRMMPEPGSLPGGVTAPGRDHRRAFDDDSLRAKMAEQNRFLANMRSVFSDSHEFISRKTGAGKMLRHISALRMIINCSSGEKEWLAETTPELRMLIKNPRISDIMKNDRVLDLMADFADGSPTALYKLGEESDIIALFNDKSILTAVRKLNLLEIRNKIRTYRIRKAVEVPLDWEMAEMEITTQFDQKLQRPRQWKNCGTMENSVTWKEGTKYGLLRAEYPGKNPGIYSAAIRTNGVPSIFISGRSVRAQTSEKGVYHYRIALDSGRTVVTAILDFRQTSEQPRCRVSLLTNPTADW